MKSAATPAPTCMPARQPAHEEEVSDGSIDETELFPPGFLRAALNFELLGSCAQKWYLGGIDH